ncbi:hypothetical protein QBC35DRAFT_534168 [Podospora australis]|uniref:Uncharacterized protein n=1 Tax=Podospora australis TaxID=1536484 RepID=A0AAN6WSD8_9PEZI|nr:hypothetical protein QBC35DRAFT_534168 [Podospora australis]
MNRPTPRKTRSVRHQPSNSRQIQASDYESDTAYYMENRNVAPQPPAQDRTNMDINMSVLRRYDPTINTILAIAANGVIYTIGEAANGWQTHGCEGPTFVCQQEPKSGPGGQSSPRACIFVLNRRGLENYVIDLAQVAHIEITGEIMAFQLEEGYTVDDDANYEYNRTFGLWMHSDETRPRETNMAIIQAVWQEVRTGNLQEESQTEDEGVSVMQPPTPAIPSTGKQISIHDLFGRKTLLVTPKNVPKRTVSYDSVGTVPVLRWVLAISQPGPTSIKLHNILFVHPDNKPLHDNNMTPTKAPRRSENIPDEDVDDPLRESLATQISLCDLFANWLDEHIEAGRDHGGIASKVKHQVESFVADLRSCLQETRDSTCLELEWVMKLEVESDEANPLEIVVTGPDKLNDAVDITAKDQTEADWLLSDEYLGYMVKACDAISNSHALIASLLDASNQITVESSDFGDRTAGNIVQTHISYLKDYNDMKDIGQQLIGLIAENRGVQIRNLYEDGQYGVTADD